MAQTLTIEQAVKRIKEFSAERRWPELETLARACLMSLAAEPRGSPDSLTRQLNEKLIESVFRQGRGDEARTVFRALARSSAAEIPESFVELYVRALARTETMPVPLNRAHRLHRLSRLLEETAALQGETAECGCFLGLSSYVICATESRRRPGFDGRGHHVFDSFEGLSEPQAEDAGDAGDKAAARAQTMRQAGAFRASLAEVRENLAEFPRIAFHPGWIPGSFAGIANRPYRLVHLDVDLFAPTAGALAYFWPRLVAGARMVCDDYGWPGARRAMDEFAEHCGVALETNEFAQAWLRKPG